MAAPRADGSDFSCRASAVRVALKQPVPVGPPLLEPVVANPPGAPCVADSAAILVPTTIGPITVDAANAETVQTPADLAAAPAANGDNATSTASVTNPAIVLGGLTISATVLSARASYTCQNGQPVPAGSSVVANLTVNGQVIAIPAGNAPFTLDLGPLGSLNLNQTVQEPNRITQRALFLTTPLADVVIAEAIADFTGNPCAAARPQCADGVDNDGDGRIDAMDPGCLSGPGGAFNPNDNDERDGPAARPQCSDTVDNDGDGVIDARDPGCLSGPGGAFNPNDNDETNRPNCSDGIDNDRDGRTDFPADRGCTSASDNSEGTATGQSRIQTSPSGIARLGLRGPCTRSSFSATVTGRRIQRVVFSLDGRRVRSDGESPFTARISTGSSGSHRVTARVTFLSDSRTSARTLRFSFRRCGARVRFTG
ncbi:MAG: hypothetical protein M3417_08970 [Actinomycetota bacterium]|nr:hypothetical protein [Actinomycetota bacterium]